MRKQYTKERPRCVCATPGEAHEIHHRPHNKVGAHLDPNCPHSELYNATIRYPAMIEARRVEQEKKQNRNRKPIRRVEL